MAAAGRVDQMVGDPAVSMEAGWHRPRIWGGWSLGGSPVDSPSSAKNPARRSWWLLRPVNAMVLGVLPSPWSGVPTAGSCGVFDVGGPACLLPLWFGVGLLQLFFLLVLFVSSVLVFDPVMFPF